MIVRKKLDKWHESVELLEIQHTTYKDKEKICFVYLDKEKVQRNTMFSINEFTFRMIDRLLKSVGVSDAAIENLYKDNESVLTICNDYNAMLRDRPFIVENEIKYVKELKKEILSKKFKPNN